MDGRKNLLVVLASSLALALACGDDDDGDTIVIVDCAGAGGEQEGGAPAAAGSPAEGGGAGSDGGAAGALAGSGGATGGSGGEPTSAGAGGEAGTPGASNSLQVVIGTRPAGAGALVLISGPAGFAQTITTTTTFADLEPGDYALLARPARVDGALVDELFAASVSDASPTLAPGGSVVVNVDYSADVLGGSGMLWTSNSGNHQLLGYSATQMAYDGAVSEEPSVVL